VRIRHTIGTGDLRAIDEWLRAWDYRSETLAAADDLHLSSRLHELDGALHLLEATERWNDVTALAPQIHRVAHDRRNWFDARALSTWAVALEARGLQGDADELFNRALLAGDNGSFVRVYVEGNPIRTKMLERLAEAEPANVHAHRVLGSAPELCSVVVRSLTDRQLAVLRLVEQGCSNKAIARELGVTLSTVKTHLRATFLRLDAVSRTQAIARARERGLL
jgi:ATP/maltotriose-dependent transcriptional regulator MalT